MKKTITKKEYYAIMGLMELARRYYEQIQECEKTYGEIVDYKEEYGSYGHFSDQIFEDGDIDKVLKNEGIKVNKSAAKN